MRIKGSLPAVKNLSEPAADRGKKELIEFFESRSIVGRCNSHHKTPTVSCFLTELNGVDEFTEIHTETNRAGQQTSS